MPITRDLVLTVNNNTASLSEPVYLYRGDRGVELRIKVQQYKYKFNRRTVEDVMTNIYAARAIVHSTKRQEHGHPDQSDSEFCFEIKAVNVEDDIVVIPINRQWIDEVTEVGPYRIQIQLYGADPVNERITIPWVEFFVEEVMCDIPDNTEDSFDNVNRTDETPTNPEYAPNAQGFDSSTKLYTPYKFFPGEVIRSVSLNSMEDALKYLTEEVVSISNTVDEYSKNCDEVFSKFDEMEEFFNNVTSYQDELDQKLEDHKTETKSSLDSLEDLIGVSETNLTDKINALDERIKIEESLSISFDEALKTEKREREERDTTLNAAIESNTEGIRANVQSIENEADAREAKDRILEDLLNQECTNRIIGEDRLQKNIDNEEAARIEQDTLLQTSINNEITARETKDNELNNLITGLRTDTDTLKNETCPGLRTDLTKLSNDHDTTKENLAKEIKDRQSAITDLNDTIQNDISTSIKELKETIDEEITVRLDTLQEDIDNNVKADIRDLQESVYTKEEIDEKNEYILNNIKGDKGDTGTSILDYNGQLDSIELLPTDAALGDSYLIGDIVYIWNGQDWDISNIRGPKGEEGRSVELIESPEGQPPVDENGEPILNALWVVDTESEEYATKRYVDDKTENSIKSTTASVVEFVVEYPEELTPGVLYILVEDY